MPDLLLFLIVAGQNLATFLPTCPLLFLNWSVFEGLKRACTDVLVKKSGFLPIYFSKVGRRKPLRHKALRVFCPLSHFFFTLKCEKNKEKYIKWKIKVGFWPEDSCRSDFRHSPVKFSSIRLLPLSFLFDVWYTDFATQLYIFK